MSEEKSAAPGEGGGAETGSETQEEICKMEICKADAPQQLTPSLRTVSGPQQGSTGEEGGGLEEEKYEEESSDGGCRRLGVFPSY